jgi:CHAT domain-containing protein
LLRSAAIGGALIVLGTLGAYLFTWRPASSPEQILQHADEMAWLNNWFGAAPEYRRAEKLFEKRGDAPLALYAHVSQLVPQIETTSMPALISEINRSLSQPGANIPEVRLRILTVKGMAELNYDAAMARRTWHEVESLAKQRHEYRLASRASGEQGILAFLLGDISDAKQRVTRAYMLSRVLHDPAARVRYAAVFGNALVELRKYQESLRWLDEAIATARNNPGIAQPTIAYNAEVDALSALGRQQEAQLLAEEALRVPRERHLLGQQYAVLTNLAVVLQRRGDWNGAISDFSQGVQYARQLSYWRGVTESGGKLAQAYEHQGDLRAGLAAVNEALEANKHIPDELYFAPRNLGIKAEIEAKLGRKKQAQDLYRKSADVIDGMLMNAPTPNIERTLISELGDIYAGDFKLASDERHYAEAFQIIEKARGRVEAQSLANHSVFAPHDPTSAEKKLNELQLELLDADEAQRRKRILDEIYQIEVQQIGTTSVRSQSLIEPVGIEKVQSQLEHNELLVEYVLQSPESYVLAITGDSVHRYSLPAKDILESQAAIYRQSIHVKKEDSATAKRLFAELLGVVPEYKQKTAVIVVPDGKLHLLPFSSLMDDQGRYLIASHTISTAPSGTVLSLLRSRQNDEADRRPYLGVAAWTQPELPPGFFRALLNGPSRSELEALPQSKAEVESIGAMLPKPSTILLGSSATKERFKQLPLEQYEVLHLALHGYVDPEFPDRSALVFAPLSEKSSGDAGFLQVREILKLRLNARLVTLSACDTGVGPVGPEGVDNVVEAFIQAGAHTVVSTLWELEDRPTTQLMKVFYNHLARGEAKADALRQAQLELWHDGAAPYYWASLQVVGDPSGNLYARS